MSRLGQLLGLIPRTPTVLRTLRHVRPSQAAAQIRHMVMGLPAPACVGGEAPVLSLELPATAFLAPPAHVKGDARHIELLSVGFDLSDGIRWDDAVHGPLFAYHLHQHEFLRLASFDSGARARVLEDWLQSHVKGIGWDPHPISLRLLCWGRLLLTPRALDLEPSRRAAILRSMGDQAATLVRGIEVRLQANHLLSNLLAVVWSGMLLECHQSEAWRAHADRLVSELDAQVHPDGGHEERSPMYHALILESILDLLNVCRAASGRAPDGLVDALEETASRMLSALEVLTHSDGRIALFADSAFDIAPEPAALLDYAERLAVSLPSRRDRGGALLAQTGYLRLSAGGFDLIASVAGPSPGHQPGHAHCDALSFELSIDGQRFVTDTGLFEYRPGVRRDIARGTASHATLEMDGREQAELWAAHRIGGRPVVELSEWDAGGTAEASCRGWGHHSPIHRRRFRVEGSAVEISDSVSGACREVVSRLPIDPGWVLESVEGGMTARCTTSDGSERRIRLDLPSEFAWEVESAPSYPSFGREIERPVLVGRADGPVEATIRIRKEP